MNNKIEKQLSFTCSSCFALYQLLETHEKEANNCQANCLNQWRKLLNEHYQEQIILNLDKESVEEKDE